VDCPANESPFSITVIRQGGGAFTAGMMALGQLSMFNDNWENAAMTAPLNLV
jgi:hypothetical protein